MSTKANDDGLFQKRDDKNSDVLDANPSVSASKENCSLDLQIDLTHEGDCLFSKEISPKSDDKTVKRIIPEPTARSAVPGVSPGRGLLISY